MKRLFGLLATGIWLVMGLQIPANAKDNLGIFSDWGAFRDPQIPRCYAISQPDAVRGSRSFKPYATIGYWPKRDIRGQFHIRVSRNIAKKAAITLLIGARRFTLAGGGADAWSRDRKMDAAIIAALRSAQDMEVRSTDTMGNTIRDVYLLRGAATAMDAAALGCARS